MKKQELWETLKVIEEMCDEDEKSTEYMLQYMQDMTGCSHDDVMEYIENHWNEK